MDTFATTRPSAELLSMLADDHSRGIAECGLRPIGDVGLLGGDAPTHSRQFMSVPSIAALKIQV
jgi:hypothetical protein